MFKAQYGFGGFDLYWECYPYDIVERIVSVFYRIQQRRVGAVNHPIGDVYCVASCWGRQVENSSNTVDSRPRVLDRRSLRKKVVEALTLLSDTGVGPDGVLRVWWPYSDEQLVYEFQKKTSPWSRMLKDSPRSTWAVGSMKCLGFQMDGIFAKKCQDKETANTTLSTTVLVKEDLSRGRNIWLDDVNIIVEKIWIFEHQEAEIAKITQKAMQPLFMAKKKGRKVREKVRPGDNVGQLVSLLAH